MEFGCFGELSTDEISDRFLLWMSLITGLDMVSLSELESEDLISSQSLAIWKQIEKLNKNVIVVGKPPFKDAPAEFKNC